MALVKDTAVKVFDTETIHRGDCIRIRRTGESECRNGYVSKVSDKEMQIIYCNSQNNAQSFLNVTAADVAIGVWEIWWTTDFQTINYEYNGGEPDA